MRQINFFWIIKMSYPMQVFQMIQMLIKNLDKKTTIKEYLCTVLYSSSSNSSNSKSNSNSNNKIYKMRIKFNKKMISKQHFNCKKVIQ